jgi:sugar phosphate permease
MKRFDMFRALKWISAIVILCGIICCVWNMREFNDRNLGLMIGIGFLVGGVQILMFGMIAPLMQKNSENVPESAKEGT